MKSLSYALQVYRVYSGVYTASYLLMNVIILVDCIVCVPGSRCILSSYLNLDGMAVNDSHAEVIARRAFIKYDFLLHCHFNC